MDDQKVDVVALLGDYYYQLFRGVRLRPESFGLELVLTMKITRRCPRCGGELILEEYQYYGYDLTPKKKVSGIALRCTECGIVAVTSALSVMRYMEKRKSKKGRKVNPVSAAITLLYRALSRFVVRENEYETYALPVIILVRISSTGKLREEVLTPSRPRTPTR